MNNESLLDAALAYASRGRAVHPLHHIIAGRCSCNDPNCDAPAKHPRLNGWPRKASTDPEVVAAWWRRWPDANIGIATGAPSGLLVVDVDPRNGGDETLADLERQHGPLPVTVESLTGGGGRHLFFLCPDGQRCGTLGAGLDVKANGGYVVAPPSVHSSGRPYAWEVSAHPADAPVAALPPWLLAMLAPAKVAPPAASILLAKGTPARAGAADIADAAQMLEKLDAGRLDDYHQWVTVGMALHHSLGDAGLPLWILHSQRSAKFQAGVCEEKWRSFSNERDEVVSLATVAQWAKEDEARTAVNSPRPDARDGEHCTDMGNAARLARRHRQDLRYCAKLGGWFVWDGRRWALDENGAVERMAKGTALGIYQEAAAAPDEAGRKALARWAVASEAATRLRAMVDLAKSEPGIAVAPEVWDAAPWLLNVANGTLDLRLGALRPHAQEDLITRLAPVEYNPDARDHVLDRYLADATGGDETFAAFLQRAVGYSLTGCTDEEVFFLVLGPAATGKSTLMEALLRMLGDYAQKTTFETFLEQRNVGAPRPDIASLRGARLVVAVETARNRRLAEPMVKELVGGDSITARFLYAQQFTFVPLCKIWLAANEAPQITDTDTGVWRRLRRVPFERVVPEDERDPDVKRRLCSPEGRTALLAWAVAGCLAWQQEGLGSCAVVMTRTAELRAEMNPIAEFLETQCVVEHQAVVSAGDLRSAYEEWASETGAKPINNRDWGTRLRGIGCRSGRERRGKGQSTVWHGIRLASDDVSEQEKKQRSVHNVQDERHFCKSTPNFISRRDFYENGVRSAHDAQESSLLGVPPGPQTIAAASDLAPNAGALDLALATWEGLEPPASVVLRARIATAADWLEKHPDEASQTRGHALLDQLREQAREAEAAESAPGAARRLRAAWDEAEKRYLAAERDYLQGMGDTAERLEHAN